jgi:hypothetical protein
MEEAMETGEAVETGVEMVTMEEAEHPQPLFLALRHRLQCNERFNQIVRLLHLLHLMQPMFRQANQTLPINLQELCLQFYLLLLASYYSNNENIVKIYHIDNFEQ